MAAVELHTTYPGRDGAQAVFCPRIHLMRRIESEFAFLNHLPALCLPGVRRVAGFKNPPSPLLLCLLKKRPQNNLTLEISMLRQSFPHVVVPAEHGYVAVRSAGPTMNDCGQSLWAGRALAQAGGGQEDLCFSSVPLVKLKLQRCLCMQEERAGTVNVQSQSLLLIRFLKSICVLGFFKVFLRCFAYLFRSVHCISSLPSAA